MYHNGTAVPPSDGVGKLLMSYNAPSNLHLSSLTNIPTTAADAITLTITGTDLYTSCSVVTVTVGTWSWLPLTCNFTSVVVRTGAGGGANLTAAVAVGPQYNNIAGLVSYAAPVITAVNVSDVLLATSGECCAR